MNYRIGTIQPSNVIVLYKTLRYFQKCRESLFNNNRGVNSIQNPSIRGAKHLYKTNTWNSTKSEHIGKADTPH